MKRKRGAFVFKNAQAAIEFLMTYGWAILVVLVVIGALAYFGVLSPSTFLPEKCTFPAGTSCNDVEVGSNGLRLILQNSGGKDIKVISISFSSDALNSLSGTCETGTVNAVVKNGEKATFYANDPLNCNFKETGRSKNKYNAEVEYSFFDSNIPHIISGELLVKKSENEISGGAGMYGGGSGDSSLVGYWNFDEGSGVIAADGSTYGNAGTLTGFTCTTLDCSSTSGWTSAGKMDKGIMFDGVNDYVNLGSPLPSSSPFTAMAWFKTPSTQSWQTVLGDNGCNGLWISISSNGNTVTAGNNCGPNTTAWGAFSLGSWHLAAVTYNGSRTNLYIDGDFKTSSDTIGYTHGTFYAGTYNGGDEIFNGAIDEVKVWNRALSAQEIAAIAS